MRTTKRTPITAADADSFPELTPPADPGQPPATSTAVVSPPNSASPAELMLQRIELELDDPRHQSVPGGHSGDPSRGARLKATAAPNNVLRPPAPPSDRNLSAKREARGGQESKRCDAQRQYLRRGECAATLPIVALRQWPSEPHPAR